MLETGYKSILKFWIFIIILISLTIVLVLFNGANFKIDIKNTNFILDNFEEDLQAEGEIIQTDKLKLEMLLDDINSNIIVEDFIIGKDNKSVIIKITNSDENAFGGTLRSDKIYKEIKIE